MDMTNGIYIELGEGEFDEGVVSSYHRVEEIYIGCLIVIGRWEHIVVMTGVFYCQEFISLVIK